MVHLAVPLWGLRSGQGPRQLTELGLALFLSSLIGWERAARHKSAGLRTHTLVGIASALMMEVSQHGFAGALGLPGVSFDPSRVAAQIVSGIGFVGGGLIFVRQDVVRGLTTAATVWLTCAVGMACGGGLPVLALAATALHFLVVRGYPPLAARLLPRASGSAFELRMTYRTGTALLPQLMETCTRHGFRIDRVKVDRLPGGADPDARVLLALEGTADTGRLTAELFDRDDVIEVEVTAADDEEATAP
ncbi:MgtC/SapB family protein [Streptomyces sp. MNP-20]|uniref:MgtC/SapB family protein n=1 Tax=Streptomyces sp. MNP-20 TaxID=2721165 RepID=UPI001553DECE|nr:MgtC/SapB family protein [Streptomyces sp. MNP-20]